MLKSSGKNDALFPNEVTKITVLWFYQRANPPALDIVLPGRPWKHI